jgi:ribosomal protein S27AE
VVNDTRSFESASNAVSDEKVVEFRIRRRETSDDEPLERLARAPKPECPHGPFVIDEKQRTVQCGKCGQWLDPVWCLLRFMEHDERVERRINHLRQLEAAAKERQARAIARKQRMERRRHLETAATDCEECDGTGWARAAGGGVVRCRCRIRLAQARLV